MPSSMAFFSSRDSKYQERTERMRCGVPGWSMSRAPSASMRSGWAMMRAHHHSNSMVATASGSVLTNTVRISEANGARVTSRGRCAITPQPVAATGA